MSAPDPLPNTIAKLLRAPLPDTQPRPGFETRLLAQVRSASPPRTFPLRLVLATACPLLLFLLVAVFISRHPASPPAPTGPPPVANHPILKLHQFTIPLETEAAAIKSSATRAGLFLLSSLPSFPNLKAPSS